MLHPLSERIVQLLCEKTHNKNEQFFRTIVPFYFGLMASSMRAVITGYQTNQDIPINIYALCLSPSGSGKGNSTSFMEASFLVGFKNRFINETMPNHALEQLEQEALRRSSRNDTDPRDEFVEVSKEYSLIGSYYPVFDSATAPAIKQQRYKILLAGCGSLNFICDEIGSNLLDQKEVLNVFLELYDLGLVKDKLTKNTKDNTRLSHMEGTTPANMLMFGAPSKTLDGGKTEEYLFEMLETGYARRCLFSYSTSVEKVDLSVDDLVAQMLNSSTIAEVEDLRDKFAELADPSRLNQQINLPVDQLKQLLTYKKSCETKAKSMKEGDELKRTELEHRYFKVLKLAGLYAWLENRDISKEDVEQAIALVELSGKEFFRMATKEQSHVKLAHYIANQPNRISLSDLSLNLPYWKGSKQYKDEMLSLAIAYGYQNNIIIRKEVEDDIIFYSGEALAETDMNKLIISTSSHQADGYDEQVITWNEIHELGEEDGFSWTNHWFVDSHRSEQNVIEGFNLLVLDVDSGYPLTAALKLFEGLTAMVYTTKRHTEEDNRYRIILPMSHILNLNKDDYKVFMANVIEDLPFQVDEQANQRSRKWLTNKGAVYLLEGDLFNVLPYIPKTKKNEARVQKRNSLEMDSLEAWFTQSPVGNRNNMLYRYACVLMEQGLELQQIVERVKALNEKLDTPLESQELQNTVISSIARRLK